MLRETELSSLAQPEKVLGNETLSAEFPDWNVGKIFDKTGIAIRRIADENEAALDLTERAALKLFNTNSPSNPRFAGKTLFDF